jgi:maleylacetate reductase
LQLVEGTRALGGRTGTQALLDLAKTLESRNSLKSIGMAENNIERATDLEVQNPYWNPRPIERGPFRDLIADAWTGNIESYT